MFRSDEVRSTTGWAGLPRLAIGV